MKCHMPPPLWICSRESGHTGPCAATPIVQSPYPFDRRLDYNSITFHGMTFTRRPDNKHGVQFIYSQNDGHRFYVEYYPQRHD